MVQGLAIGLTVLDLLVVCAELFILEHYIRCNDDVHDTVHHVEEALGIVSVSILCILGFEVLLLLVAFGLQFFSSSSLCGRFSCYRSIINI